MGIKSLWQVLDAVKESKSLLTLAAEHRAQAQSAGISGGDATLTLGVDMGACMAECSAGALAAGVHSQRAGGASYIFFKKLAEFTKAPVALIFVVDGSARPPFKRGHEVRDQPIWWLDLAIELIEIFGYQIHRAPGEAEAELAKLNTEGFIHAVITSDGDAFLFGTQLLLRSIPKNDRQYPDEYSLYSASKAGFPLMQGGILLYALLCGGDYDHGITGCGPTTAVALARCGYGDQLLAAYHNRHRANFERFLSKWRCDIRAELMTNSQHFLTRRQFDVAREISYEFPDRRVLSLYASPITSWSPGRIPPDPSQWQFKQPSISAITEFCAQHFELKAPQMIKQNLKTNLWEGIFLQMMYSSSATYNSDQQQLQLPDPDSRHASVLKVSRQIRRGKFMRMFGPEPQPRLVVSTANFIDLMGSRFVGNDAIDKVTVYPPAALLPPPLQRLIQRIEQASGKKKKLTTHRRAKDSAAALQAPAMPHPHATGTAIDGAKGEWVQISEHHWYIDLT